MKKFLTNNLVSITIGLMIFGTACGTLIPKRVEFFQKKVKAVPEQSEKQKETQRQAADYVATKTDEAKTAAVATKADPTVITPIAESHIVAEALSLSLGPPSDPWKDEAERLALKLKSQEAAFNAKLESYRTATDKLEGKKIENTGLIRIPYFAYIGGIVLILFLLWTGLKVYGSINPVVGLGVNSVGRISSSVLQRAVGEIITGGEAFKSYYDEKAVPKIESLVKSVMNNPNLNSLSAMDSSAKSIVSQIRDEIMDLFNRAHRENQSQDTQSVIKKLTLE